ncbi:MAG TPA: bifunctional UDP-sugar hydrolase/5'-nucleotidase [Flexilinea sp.]|nr:bifunctional UDP-sugar hydrolase/5'-nucleotidase [Flexilinea sp.]HPJ65532.1 bifunctional UDP-sugar hydrolase/5'-nucleotidase [Flexilinea sp.]HPR71739.1 bifunctional UDP-sugar hydrolase/5'-nucleotidase [Flexilinea sp.]
MKQKIRAISLFIIFILFFSSLTAFAQDTESATADIVFTHDLHSYIDPVQVNENGVLVEKGGFARIKTIIDSVKKQNENTFVLDGGDFSMGTLYQSVFSEKALELRLLGLMGYQATTIGNHEFDYRSDGLAKMLDAAKASNDPLPIIVQSNINWEASQGEYTEMLHKSMENYGVKKYAIIQAGDLKAAVFGLMGKEAASYAPTSGLIFDDIVESSKEIVNEIKKNENVDLIIALSHSGTNSDPKSSEDEILAKEVPEIDVIISGHSHTYMDNPILIGDTAVVSAGEYGRFVGNLKLSKKENNRWKVDQFTPIPVDESIEPDPDLQKTIDHYRESLNSYIQLFGFDSYDQIIARNPYPFDSVQALYKDPVDNPLGNLISDSYVYEIKKVEGENYIPVDVAIVPVGIIRSTLNQGDIHVRDAYEILSLGIGEDGISGYPLISVYLTGAELRMVAEIDASLSDLMSGTKLYWSGLYSEFNPHRMILNRVVDVKLIGEDGSLKDLDDKKLYRVVAGLYSGQMLGAVESMSKGLLQLKPKDKDGNPLEGFSSVIIKNQSGMEVKEWYAFADYLSSFEKTDGISTITAKYAKSEGRKVINDSTEIKDILRNPSAPFLKVAGILLLAILIIVLIIILLVKLIRRITRKQSNKIAEK